MPRYAAIDIGTNSVKVTITDVGDGTLTDILDEQSRVTRLGKGVDKTRRLDDAAVEATLQAIRDFAAHARKLDATRIVAGGTSAMRDAVNGRDFRRRAAQIIGGEVEVVTGDREAELTFFGAMSDRAVAGQGAVAAFDVGGGSTELIIGQSAPVPRVDLSRSLDIGAVRLTERYLPSEKPTQEELELAGAAVEQPLATFLAPGEIHRVIGIGGTVVNVASMIRAGRGARVQSGDVQGAVIAAADVDSLIERLAGMTLDERKAVPGLDPSRADVIVAGMLIVRRVLGHFAQDSLVASTRGVRHGMLLELAS